MSLFKHIKLKLKKKSPVITKTESSSEILKEQKDILVTGHRSEAIGVNAFAIPTGICSEPVSEELEEYIKKDKIGQLLNNPIHHCIFYNKSTNYCFFAGFCNKKQEISNSRIKEYKEYMLSQIGDDKSE